jgi:8-oxo-dGTP pyrophosphatase MutT (NUDIX family)
VREAPNGRRALVQRLLVRHDCWDVVERRAVDATRALLGDARDPFGRSTLPGHVTASAIVLDESREHLLVVWHEGLALWLQPGGHCEPDDEFPAVTAVREVAEETDVRLTGDPAAAPLVHVDVHDIPARGAEPAHRHHDLRFAFRAPARDSRLLVEGAASGWVRLDALNSLGLDASLRKAVSRALHALQAPAGHREADASN